ncbi:PspC domain-containing protein [Chondrinema litorale]|uniref:PspC domain-containing protein n=1 Tax=Chondrinema litorale TaxID=2994555 RepID=UPI0025438AF3|nr:PspC domain-containing protein [Chondrinema litorale]UZR93692.1 PspC domain-containing protein [Chondrinema litorale]
MKLVKSSYNKMLTGVCGGIGNYLGIDATVVRALFGVSVIVSFGTTLLVYAILSFIMPSEYEY